MALVGDDPGNTQALQRLALLETQAGRLREAEQFHRRKAEIDRTQHQFNTMLLDGAIDSSRAEALARLADEARPQLRCPGVGLARRGHELRSRPGKSAVEPGTEVPSTLARQS